MRICRKMIKKQWKDTFSFKLLLLPLAENYFKHQTMTQQMIVAVLLAENKMIDGS